MNRLAIIFLALGTTAAAQDCVNTSVDLGVPFVFSADLLEVGDIITAEHARGCAGRSIYGGGPNAAVPVHVEVRLPVAEPYDRRRLRPGRYFSIYIQRGEQRISLLSRGRRRFLVPTGEDARPRVILEGITLQGEPPPGQGFGWMLQALRPPRLFVSPLFVFDRGLGQWVATDLDSLGPGVHIIRIGR